MKNSIFLMSLLVPILVAAQQPTMDRWTTAWQNSNREKFRKLYADSASIFPSNGVVITENRKILNYMAGGMGQVKVVFQPKRKIVTNKLAFEFGEFDDIDINTEKVTGTGNYSIMWILEKRKWKILCHAWSKAN